MMVKLVVKARAGNGLGPRLDCTCRVRTSKSARWAGKQKTTDRHELSWAQENEPPRWGRLVEKMRWNDG
jgi:hypothetical protein